MEELNNLLATKIPNDADVHTYAFFMRVSFLK